MFKKKDAILLLEIILITVLIIACNRPTQDATPTPDLNAAGTIAAQTIEAQRATLTAQNIENPVPTTAQPIESTEVASSTPSQIPTSPQKTQEPPQPVDPIISANVETNCRVGPSPNYDIIGYILVGQESTVHGKNSSNNWWYIKNPKNPNQFCWVWGETTLVTGDTSTLPIITPPPLPTTPAVSYQVSFSNIHNCSGNATVVFQIGNDGDVGFRSAGLSIKDLGSGTVIYGPDMSNAPFLATSNDCPTGADSLGPGATAFIAGVIGPAIPSGGTGRATIIICTEPSLQGTCIEKKIDFPWP
jgi:hypothetical protein